MAFAIKGGGGFSPTATASIDGAVEVHTEPPTDFGAGRYSGVPSSMVLFGCAGSWQLPLTIELRERSSGVPVGTLARDGYAVEFKRGSPDGRSVLFAVRTIRPGDRPGGRCFDTDIAAGWLVWSLEGGVADVPDLRPLLQSWDGNRFIDLECEGKPLPLNYPLDERYLMCNSGAATPPATLLVGGEMVGVVHDATIIGFTGP